MLLATALTSALPTRAASRGERLPGGDGLVPMLLFLALEPQSPSERYDDNYLREPQAGDRRAVR